MRVLQTTLGWLLRCFRGGAGREKDQAGDQPLVIVMRRADGTIVTRIGEPLFQRALAAAGQVEGPHAPG